VLIQSIRWDGFDLARAARFQKNRSPAKAYRWKLVKFSIFPFGVIELCSKSVSPIQALGNQYIREAEYIDEFHR
jgi:hypothetical protein